MNKPNKQAIGYCWNGSRMQVMQAGAGGLLKSWHTPSIPEIKVVLEDHEICTLYVKCCLKRLFLTSLEEVFGQKSMEGVQLFITLTMT